MNALTSILAATDFSTPARHAGDRAARLAHASGAHLCLMHVLPGAAIAELRRWLGAGQTTEAQLLADAQQQLDADAADLAAHRHVTPQTHLASGAVLEAIDQQADAVAADLIVVGARGAGFMRRLAVGTTSERLLRKTTRPILVVRQTPHEAYRRMLVAIDFSPWSVPALALARRVAPHAHLVLASVFEVPFEGKLRFAGVDDQVIEQYRRDARRDTLARLQALATQARLPGGAWQPCVAEGDASLRLVELEQEHDCELVVLGKHGMSAVEDLLLGSVTKHLLAEAQGDVLVSARSV
jgi:nucleotide-binding universal stress UspA family protein